MFYPSGILRPQPLHTCSPAGSLPGELRAEWSQHASTIPCLTSPETLLRIPGVWWGCLSPDPRRQKTSQFGDYEERNTQHSGFRISAPRSSLHCIRAGRTRGRDERSVMSRPSALNMARGWLSLLPGQGRRLAIILRSPTATAQTYHICFLSCCYCCLWWWGHYIFWKPLLSINSKLTLIKLYYL